MVEKERKINTLSYLGEAVKFDIELNNRLRYENDYYPMSFLEKILFTLKSLSPKEARILIRNYASFSWGRHILTQVFPKEENPEEYHSRGGVVCLNEHPRQVLGWEDVKRLKKEGVKKALDSVYIDLGFEKEAENTGIDLEWSFFETPPQVGHNEHKLME